VKHPGSKVALAAEQVAVLQYPEKGVLDQVFAHFLVPVHAIEEAIKRPLVALKQEPKLVQVAVADLDHQ
jgi:hypothetical protein